MSDKFDMLRQLLSEGSTSDYSLFCNGNKEDIIIIGGTRFQTFNLPFSYELIHKIMAVYVQNGRIIIKKVNEQFQVSEIDDTLLYLRLEENETSLFKEGPIEVQLKVLLEDGSILVSDILHTKGVMAIDSGFFVDGHAPIIALQADVDSNDITLNKFFSIPAGSEMLFKTKFIFDSSWDIFSKTAVFKDEYNNIVRVQIDSNNLCSIPSKVIAYPGNIYVSVIGKYNDVVKPSTWSNAARVITSPLYDYSTISHTSSDVSVEEATEDTAGIMKLYSGAGYNTDGTVTQRSITEGFDSITLTTAGDDDECLVLNVDF